MSLTAFVKFVGWFHLLVSFFALLACVNILISLELSDDYDYKYKHGSALAALFVIIFGAFIYGSLTMIAGISKKNPLDLTFMLVLCYCTMITTTLGLVSKMVFFTSRDHEIVVVALFVDVVYISFICSIHALKEKFEQEANQRYLRFFSLRNQSLAQLEPPPYDTLPNLPPSVLYI